MKNNRIKMLLTALAAAMLLVLFAAAAHASSVIIPGLEHTGTTVDDNRIDVTDSATIANGSAVNSGYKELESGDSVGVLLTGRDGKDGKDGEGGLVVIRPGDENTAADNDTDTPSDPWQTGGLRYKDASLFPDGAFRNFLDAIDSDKNGSISPEEAAAYFDKNGGCMDLTNHYDTIYDYTGVECFAAWLTALHCKPTGGVPLKLDVSGLTQLEELVCSNCALTELDVSACSLLADAVQNGTKVITDGTGTVLSEQEAALNPAPETLTVTYTKDGATLTLPYTAQLLPGADTAEEDSSVPEQPEDPAADDLCKWCNKPHTGFFGKLTSFIHSILYFFARLFGRK